MDAFNEIPEFKRFVGYYRLVQTPPDKLMGGCALTPALSGEPDRLQAAFYAGFSHRLPRAVQMRTGRTCGR